MQYCERLQEMIDRANPDYNESAFEKPQNPIKGNPFYMALDA